jgi:hypothetical protein
VTFTVKSPTATARPPPAAPAAPAAPARSEIDERLFQATQSANCTLLLEALLEGANPNLRDPNGRTGLHFMAGVGLAPACVLLIHFGADVDAKDKSNLAPIHMAAGYANARCLRVLIAAGADTQARGEQGTALDVVERLGEYQLDVFLNRTGVEKVCLGVEGICVRALMCAGYEVLRASCLRAAGSPSLPNLGPAVPHMLQPSPYRTLQPLPG